MNPAVVHLITQANGVSALLFHVEHFSGQRWFYRWRITGKYPPEYLCWREGAADGARVMLHPEIIACGIEAQWRADEGAEWSQATLRAAARGSASFRVKALQSFDAPRGFRGMAVVGEGIVACYYFGALALAAGVETVIRGVADGPYPDDLLLAAGEFVSCDPLIELENVAPSEDCLIESQDPLLRPIPGHSERRVFARAACSVDQPLTPVPSHG